jgi:hypothetical protein
MPGELSGKAAIVGIGATDFSKNSGRSELRLASEAVLDALEDAGLTPADVDGMVTFTMDSNTEVAIARATGIGELKFFSKIHHGGGAACATIQQAAIAVATGVADCVVAYRAFNERSGMRFGQVQMRLVENADSAGVDNSFSYPHGLSTPAAQVAMIAKRYMHLSGATSKDFGAVSVADRKHAAKNPKAYSRWSAGRGVHPRHERHRQGCASAARHVCQPGVRRRARARHRRHRRAHLRPRAGLGLQSPVRQTAVLANVPQRSPTVSGDCSIWRYASVPLELSGIDGHVGG